MVYELRTRGLKVESEVPLPLRYKAVQLSSGYRLDLVVENSVVVELKAVEKLPPVAYVQLLSYLRLTNRRIGLLINFHVSTIRMGIRRVINGK
jgi:GxxExxY protein